MRLFNFKTYDVFKLSMFRAYHALIRHAYLKWLIFQNLQFSFGGTDYIWRGTGLFVNLLFSIDMNEKLNFRILLNLICQCFLPHVRRFRRRIHSHYSSSLTGRVFLGLARLSVWYLFNQFPNQFSNHTTNHPPTNQNKFNQQCIVTKFSCSITKIRN